MSEQANKVPATAEAEDVADLPTFLRTIPPGSSRRVLKWHTPMMSTRGGPTQKLLLDGIPLYCSNAACQRVQLFSSFGDVGVAFNLTMEQEFINLRCNNCQREVKTYAVSFGPRHMDKPVVVRKLGEYPHYGEPTPTRLITILGGDKELYEKGRRAESQGMGIGAAAYYRRVVEKRKGEIIDKFIAVAQKSGGSSDLIKQLEAAKKETQFTTAIDHIKAAIPDVLKIEGYNPLTLLHDALSDSLHALSDEECLALAQNIRRVLVAMVERMTLVLTDDAELTKAVKALANRPLKK